MTAPIPYLLVLLVRRKKLLTMLLETAPTALIRPPWSRHPLLPIILIAMGVQALCVLTRRPWTRPLPSKTSLRTRRSRVTRVSSRLLIMEDRSRPFHSRLDLTWAGITMHEQRSWVTVRYVMITAKLLGIVLILYSLLSSDSARLLTTAAP